MSWNGDTTGSRRYVGGNDDGGITDMTAHPHRSQLHHNQPRPLYQPLPPSPMLRRRLEPQQGKQQQQRSNRSISTSGEDGSHHVDYYDSATTATSKRIEDRFLQNQHHQLYPTSLLLSPPRGIQTQESDGSSSRSYQPPSEAHHHHHHHHVRPPQQPPFLTIVLMKIDQLLPRYCQHLSDPTHANATLACNLLDSVMTTTSTVDATTHYNCSNNDSKGHPETPTKRWLTLPQRSPSSAFPTPAILLENEWETYASPFLLLAAAEVLYSNLEHLQPPQPTTKQNRKVEDRFVVSNMTSLLELYERIDQDLRYIQEILCEPFLRSSDSTTTALSLPKLPSGTIPQPPQQRDYHYYAAVSLTDSIRVLSVIVSIRCQMISFQSLIFAVTRSIFNDYSDDSDEDEKTDQPTFFEAAAATTMWLQSVETTIATLPLSPPESQHYNDTAEVNTNDVDDYIDDVETLEIMTRRANEPCAVLSLLQALRKELKAWRYCFDTCAALERCQFMDTIISLRYWQLHLPSNENDRIYSKYMNESFQHVRSILPVYFDRTRTYASHCYGINTSVNNTDSDDHDSVVLDLLYRQDKSSGTSMAIGIVFDAVSTSNWHVERGYCVNMETDMRKSDDVRVIWPAIYLRSTMHLPTPAPPKSDVGGSGSFASSQASLLSNWAAVSSHGLSIPGGSPFSLASRKQPLIGISPTTTPPSHRKSKTLSNTAAPQLPFSDVTAAAESSGGYLQSKLHALEYGPEFGAVTSWPHTDWQSIAHILSERNIPNKNNFRLDMNVRGDSHEGVSMAGEKDTVREVVTELSTVYNLSLGPFLTLVVLIKDTDHDSRLPQQRKTQVNPDDIKSFMCDDLGPKLRVSTIFSPAFIASFMNELQQLPKKEAKKQPLISSKAKTQLYLPTRSVGVSLSSSSSFWSNEYQVQEFLSIIKSSFGLRPSSPVRNSSSNRSLLWGTPRTPTEVMKNFQQQRRRDPRNNYPHYSDTASAAMFFLGPDLASSFD